MKKAKLAVLSLLLIVSLIILFEIVKSHKINKKAKFITSKILQFKSDKGVFPETLENVGESTTLEGPVFYEKYSDGSCILWVSGVLGESKVFLDSNSQISSLNN